MGNKSLIANWIAKCEKEVKSKCETNECKNCQFWGICIKISKLNAKFESKGYLK